eukprot:m.55545 g.55545  ORF g.55545 m.55545 type:complete len:57 (-) comp11498_c0_seq1:139-309(-)
MFYLVCFLYILDRFSFFVFLLDEDERHLVYSTLPAPFEIVRRDLACSSFGFDRNTS